VTKSPHVLLSIDDWNLVYLWIEDSIKQKGFFLAYTVRVGGIQKSCSLDATWVSFLKQSQQVKRSPEYVCGNESTGIYTLSAGLPVVLGLLVPGIKLVIYRFYNVLNIETQILSDEPIEFTHQVFTTLSKIITIRMTNSEIAQLLAMDKNFNIVKIQLNMVIDKLLTIG